VWLVVGAIAIASVGAGVAAALLLLPALGGSFAPGVKELTVSAERTWTDTGITCAAGDTFNIKGTGQAWFSTEESDLGPDGFKYGYDLDTRATASARPAALLGTLDTDDEPFVVGYAATYVCPVAGRLSLGVNDNSPQGNRGGFLATITHRPAE
jgi:hypothetical protein